MPSYNGATPTKPSTAEHSYSFKGWDPEITTVTGNTTYTAQFTESTKKYTIKFVNYDGSVLQNESLDYGSTPTYKGATPTKPSTAEHSYSFKGWNPEITTVTKDATYTAQFTESTNKYTVTWKNYDGSVLETDTDVPYGATPSYDGTTPTKPGTVEHSYTFSGWNPAITTVSKDATYTAQFTESVNKYTITAKAETGGSITSGTGEYNYGAECTIIASPYEGYSFDGWYEKDTKIEGAEASYTFTVTASRILTAKFTPNTYTITTTVTNGNYSGDTSITYGSSASVTLTPNTNYKLPSSITVSGATYTYNSTSGVVSLSNPTDNVTISCTCVIKTYTVSVSVTNGSYSGSTSINAGSTASGTITATGGYKLPSSISVSNATLSSYDSSTGAFTISNPTGNVSVTVSCPEKTIVLSLNNNSSKVDVKSYKTEISCASATISGIISMQSKSIKAVKVHLSLQDSNYDYLYDNAECNVPGYECSYDITVSDFSKLKAASWVKLIIADN